VITQIYFSKKETWLPQYRIETYISYNKHNTSAVQYSQLMQGKFEVHRTMPVLNGNLSET